MRPAILLLPSRALRHLSAQILTCADMDIIVPRLTSKDTELGIPFRIHPLSNALELRSCASETDLRLLVADAAIGLDILDEAHRLAIPVLHLVTGLEPYAAPIARDDAAAAAGPHAVHRLIQSGVPQANIRATGYPPWDTLIGPISPSERKSLCRIAGLEPLRFTIGFDPSRDNRALLSRILNMLPGHYPHVQFLINTPFAPSLHRNIFSGHFSVEQLAILCDIIITSDPLLAVEATLASRTVFLTSATTFLSDTLPLPRIQTPETLLTVLERSIRESISPQTTWQHRQSIIETFAHPHDGLAARRVAAFITEIAAEPQKWVTGLVHEARIDTALSDTVSPQADHILVLGEKPDSIAAVLQRARPNAHVTAASVDTAPPTASFAAAVLAEPLPPNDHAETALIAARRALRPNGRILFAIDSAQTFESRHAFRIGRWAPPMMGGRPAIPATGFTDIGTHIVLSRAGFEATEKIPLMDPISMEARAHIIVAQPRSIHLSTFGEARLRRRAQAQERNAEGETYFQTGDALAALTAFAEASELWSENAAILNNLASALYALGHREQAWLRVCEALHHDPAFTPARDQLRRLAIELGYSEEADHILALFGHD